MSAGYGGWNVKSLKVRKRESSGNAGEEKTFYRGKSTNLKASRERLRNAGLSRVGKAET